LKRPAFAGIMTPVCDYQSLRDRRGSLLARSLAVIVLFMIVGPVFGASFFIAYPDIISFKFFELMKAVFVTWPIVGLFAMPAAIVPATVTGFVAAIVSAVTRSHILYISACSLTGAVMSAGWSGLLGSQPVKLTGSGAFAALCCSVISCAFRFRPLKDTHPGDP
jgi:hypothetical protein